MTEAFGLPARNGLHASLAGGTLHPPAPAVCLLDGLPPRRLRGQGSLRAHECSLRLRRPLDRSGVDAARRYRPPGAGEELSPTSRQETRTVADHTAGSPTPAGTCRPTNPRKEDQAPVRTTTAPNRASRTHRAPRRGHTHARHPRHHRWQSD
jgi:hypothetical protein